MHILAVVSDLHAGHTCAICPLVVELDDGGTHHASPGQRFLWRSWLTFWDRVEAAAEAAHADTITTVINGDALELDTKGRSYQLISRNKSTVLRMAAEILERPAQLSGRLVFVRGTPAHVGKSAWSEEELAADFDNTLMDGANASWPFINLKVENVLFNIQHKGPLGGKPWNKLNPVNAMAYELMLANPRPDVAIRSHMHQFYDTGDNFPIRCIGTGAWQLRPDYVMGSTPPCINGVIMQIDERRLDVEQVTFEPARGRVVTLG